jgi:TolA-binding protein
MNKYFTISLLGGLIFSSGACATPPAQVIVEDKNPSVEMHVWSPPDEHELSLRRHRQEMLDSISRDIEILSLKNQGIVQQTQVFGSKLKQIETDTSSFEDDFKVKIQFKTKQQEQLKRELAKININQNILKSRITTFAAMKSRPKTKIVPKKVYTAAVQLLKDGQFKRSMHKFNVALKNNPPVKLKDNIHFGLATAYYKLRKYSKAIDQLNAIRKNFPKGDKWYMSHVMLGMIHNQKGEKSRALFILNEALKKNPPQNIRKMIDLMLNKIQGGAGHVAS